MPDNTNICVPDAKKYELLQPKEYYLHNFRIVLDDILYILKSTAPTAARQDILRLHQIFLKDFYHWIALVIEVEFNKETYNVNYSLYPTLRETFKLSDAGVDDVYKRHNNTGNMVIDKLIDIQSWGNIYWKFLHYGSILTREQKNVDTLMAFACVLRNLQIIIPCGECGENYKKKNVFEKLALPFVKPNGDPITAIFNLHNLVNAAPRRFGPIMFFSILQFENLYQIKRIEN
jgi:hypothetical protein